MTGTKKTRDVGMKAHEVTAYDLRSPDPAEHQAHHEAWKRFAEAWPKDEAGDGPLDALRRGNAEICRKILGTVGLADLMDGKFVVHLNPLREKGLNEGSAQWIAAHWLRSYNLMMAVRKKVSEGDTSAKTLAELVMHAEELGTLQERLWWRCGVDQETKEKRETLAMRERAVNLGRKAGGNENASRAQLRREKTHSIAREVCQARTKPISNSDLARRVIDRWDDEDPPGFSTVLRYLKHFPSHI